MMVQTGLVLQDPSGISRNDAEGIALEFVLVLG